MSKEELPPPLPPSLAQQQQGTMLPSAPLFARGAGSGVNVLQETLARQNAMRNTLDLSMFPDADDEEDGVPVDSSTQNVSRNAARKSPTLSRRSPAMRSTGRNASRDPPPTKILDFLFLGSVQDAKNVDFLHRNNITQILNVSQEEYYSPDPSRVVVRWFHAEDTCNFDIQKLFPPTEHILQTARKFYFSTKEPHLRERVLVHCQKGRSRSATIVMAHLIRSNGWSVAEALQWVSSLREQVEPNLGFIEALRELQESMTHEERTLQRSRRCLLIRNMVSEELVVNGGSTALRTQKPHTPLERDARKSADGTQFPLLTLDVLRSFFTENIGTVVDVQVKVKNKEVIPAEGNDLLQETEGSIAFVDAERGSLALLPEQSAPPSSNESDAALSREHTSGGGPGTSSTDDNQVPTACGRDGSSSTAEDPNASAVQLRAVIQRSSLSRTNSGLPETITKRSAQILVEFACHENVDIAGMLKKTDVNRYFPICPNPSTLLFQKPLSKTAAKKRLPRSRTQSRQGDAQL